MQIQSLSGSSGYVLHGGSVSTIPLTHITFTLWYSYEFQCLLILIAAGKQQQQHWESLFFVLLLAGSIVLTLDVHWRNPPENPEPQPNSLNTILSIAAQPRNIVSSTCFPLLSSHSFPCPTSSSSSTLLSSTSTSNYRRYMSPALPALWL